MNKKTTFWQNLSCFFFSPFFFSFVIWIYKHMFEFLLRKTRKYNTSTISIFSDVTSFIHTFSYWSELLGQKVGARQLQTARLQLPVGSQTSREFPFLRRKNEIYGFKRYIHYRKPRWKLEAEYWGIQWWRVYCLQVNCSYEIFIVLLVVFCSLPRLLILLNIRMASRLTLEASEKK